MPWRPRRLRIAREARVEVLKRDESSCALQLAYDACTGIGLDALVLRET